MTEAERPEPRLTVHFDGERVYADINDESLALLSKGYGQKDECASNSLQPRRGSVPARGTQDYRNVRRLRADVPPAPRRVGEEERKPLERLRHLQGLKEEKVHREGGL